MSATAPVLTGPPVVAMTGLVGLMLALILGVMDAGGQTHTGCPVEDDRATCAEVIGR